MRLPHVTIRIVLRRIHPLGDPNPDLVLCIPPETHLRLLFIQTELEYLGRNQFIIAGCGTFLAAMCIGEIRDDLPNPVANSLSFSLEAGREG
jgi:hypothetical protein